ncbi:hypothetical protein [Virgibacillus sp. DJP39]|uniref:hypothetical protein n=1 Tax=Virgibacillus sp. DJP39 TaxID=3409790 RepID=UPI003BB7FC2B
MKKILLFLLLAIILGACGEQEPPKLKISSNNEEVFAVLGTYSWSSDNMDGTSTAIDSDSDIPPKIVVHQKNPLNSKLGSEINLDFGQSPQGVRVNIWDNSQKVREVDVEGTTFKTDEKGYIVYEIIATWDQGSVHYAVKINVQ